MEFIRFAGTINTHEEKKVAKATVNVILENCTGTFYMEKWYSPTGHLRLLQRCFAESRKVRLYGMKISVIIQKSRPTILQCLTVRGRFGRMKVLTVSVSIRSWKAVENWHWIIPDFLKSM